jgi:hypothetical protein
VQRNGEMTMSGRLKGKVSLVTGGERGDGQGACRTRCVQFVESVRPASASCFTVTGATQCDHWKHHGWIAVQW